MMTALNIRSFRDGVLFEAQVKPTSPRARIKVGRKKGMVISVTNPPVKGQANRELLKLFHSDLGLEVSIHKSWKNYRKTLFAPLPPAEFSRLLEKFRKRS